MGGSTGKSSGQQQTTVQLTPEQRETLQIQNAALRDTFLPAYQSTVTGAKDIYGQVAPAATEAARTASDVAGTAGALQGAVGAQSYLQGAQGLSSLFSDDYKTKQIQAAMQPAREEIREQIGSQNAMFGGAGGAGSSRAALARENLSQLGEQRLGTVAAATSADIEGRRQQAAGSLLGAGQAGLSAAQQAAASRVGLAGVPQDIYQKYAAVVFGTPQGSTTPNYTGTQGNTQTGSSKSSGTSFSF
jgi:hypothetical protein